MHHPISGINSLILSVSLASHVSTHLLIHLSAHLYIIITITLIIHYSFTLSIQPRNLPFQQILLTFILLLPLTGPDRTYHASDLFFVRFYR